MAGDEKTRDGWDKLQVLASLLVPISVAVVGGAGTWYLNKQRADDELQRESQQESETRDRLYVELQTSRERADSELRKSMFDSVIRTFLRPESRDPAELVLALELLAYNFHEVIDLGPLFKHVEGIVRQAKSPKDREEYVKRLERAAAEVTEKQLAALKDASVIVSDDVSFSEVEGRPEGVRLFRNAAESKGYEGAVRLEDSDRGVTRARVDVIRVDRGLKQLRVKLYVYRLPPTDALASGAKLAEEPEVDIPFDVSHFDFPMIDNTRLTNGRRIAIVVQKWEQDYAKVALAYFPGSRASLKEKPYYEELMQQLRTEQERQADRSKAAAGRPAE
jgi:hypothetical protein